MISAAYTDKAVVVEILSNSFDSNKSVNFVVKQDAKRKERIRFLMDYSFEVCWMFGNVYLSEDKKACALVMLPENKRSTIKSWCLDVQLAFRSFGIERINKIKAREKRIKALYPQEPTCYLWFLGVAPELHRKGIGKKLLQEIIAEAEISGRPLCLETSVASNVEWYEKYGFRVYATVDVGYPLFMMRREP